LNLCGLVLSFLQIFYVKIKKEIEKNIKRGKKPLANAMGNRGPGVVPCGPSPRITATYILKSVGTLVLSHGNVYLGGCVLVGGTGGRGFESLTRHNILPFICKNGGAILSDRDALGRLVRSVGLGCQCARARCARSRLAGYGAKTCPASIGYGTHIPVTRRQDILIKLMMCLTHRQDT
jgi:hypothetical protein